MELSTALRTGYFSALNGNVTYNGNPVKVYDTFALPEDAGYPYILLSSQTSQQRGIKTSKVYDATILIDIVTGEDRPIGRMPAEQIAEQVENIINTTNIDITANGYAIGSTNRESDTDLGNKNDMYYIFRKLMSYRHIINKL
jgi:hypothetical protein